MEVADRVVVMNQGRIEQQGSPDEVYDHPATPFVLQFLGDVNLFHGRLGQSSTDDVTYVRPHELEVVAQAGPDTWPVTFSQALTVGPNTRIEFKRDGAEGYIDVELAREAYNGLRERITLNPGSRVHLRPRRVRRFGVPEAADVQEDPAAAI